MAWMHDESMARINGVESWDGSMIGITDVDHCRRREKQKRGNTSAEHGRSRREATRLQSTGQAEERQQVCSKPLRSCRPHVNLAHVCSSRAKGLTCKSDMAKMPKPLASRHRSVPMPTCTFRLPSAERFRPAFAVKLAWTNPNPLQNCFGAGAGGPELL